MKNITGVILVVFGTWLYAKVKVKSIIWPLILFITGLFLIFSDKNLPEDNKTLIRKESIKPKEPILKLGEGIKIGELLLTFDSIRTTKIDDSGSYTIKKKAKPNYKLIVVKVKCKNVGKERDDLELSMEEMTDIMLGRSNEFVESGGNILEQDYKIEVDKGYIYDTLWELQTLNFNLLPEEIDVGNLVFEIPESTIPIKLHSMIKGQKFTVILK
jgi:hypothetical protein